MPEYLTVGNGCAEFYEKKSRFIGSISHAETQEQARDFIGKISGKYPGATHNVFCYILRADNTIRFSDDGEPSGTAGKPALEILMRSCVKDVCLVITRYFGGVLLGAGGLVRAYANAAKLALENGGVLKMSPRLRVRAVFSYADWARAEPALKETQSEVEGVDYGAEVTAALLVPPEDFPVVSQALKNISAGRAKIAVTGEIMKGERRDG